MQLGTRDFASLRLDFLIDKMREDIPALCRIVVRLPQGVNSDTWCIVTPNMYLFPSQEGLGGMHVSESRLDSRQKLPSGETEIRKIFKAASQVCSLKPQALETQIENRGKKMHGSSHKLLNHNYRSNGQFSMLLIHDGFAAFTTTNLSNPS